MSERSTANPAYSEHNRVEDRLMHDDTPSVDDYWRTLARVLPDIPPGQQRTAVTLYRELAKGQPLSTADVARALGITAEAACRELAEEPLNAFIYADGERVAGFGGLATAPMHHEFEVRGRSLWTWCAWDSLFIPSVLNETAQVSSPDPQSGVSVRLTVSPVRIEMIEPADTVVSFLLPEADSFNQSATNVMASFCHHVFFFASRASADRWRETHAGTFFYSPHAAFELGQRLVTRQLGDALRRRPAA